MSNHTYTFHMRCPKCNADTMVDRPRRQPPPDLKCGDCIMERTEIIPLRIVAVFVNDEDDDNV